MNAQENTLLTEVLKNAMLRALDARKFKSSLEVLSSSIAHVHHILDMASGKAASPALDEVILTRLETELDSIKTSLDVAVNGWEKYSDDLMLEVSKILKEFQ